MAEMNPLLRVSTPATVAAFVVSGVTGVLLFFHLGERLFKELHEWLGLAFVTAALLHLVRNRKALGSHARKPTLWIASGLALVAAAAFIVPAMAPREGGGDGSRRLLQAMMAAPLEQVAPILATTPAELSGRLTAAGFTVAGPTTSLRDVAKASGRSPQELTTVLVQGLPAPSGPR
jgi:hypothetical protein